MMQSDATRRAVFDRLDRPVQPCLLGEKLFPISGIGGEFAYDDSADNAEGQYRTEQVKNQEQDEPLGLFV